MSSSKVPFLDLKAHHDPIRQEVMAAMNEVIDLNAFAGGPFVTKFEEAYAKFCGAEVLYRCRQWHRLLMVLSAGARYRQRR